MPSSLNQEIEALRPALLRFALLQLRNDTLAEDVVQDALLAILEKPERFAGLSSLRTYVTGILKHKIIDALRRPGREIRIEAESDQSETDMIDALFRANGHPLEPPRQWGDPDSTLEQKDFFQGTGALPGKAACQDRADFHDAGMAGARYRRNL